MRAVLFIDFLIMFSCCATSVFGLTLPEWVSDRMVLPSGSDCSITGSVAPGAVSLGVFRDSCEKELPVSAAVLPSGGSKHRPDLRPDGCAERILSKAILSRSAPTNQISRSRRSGSGLSCQRFFTPCPDGCRALQRPVADRAVLQVDQAAPAHQGLLRNQRERRENADLDRHLRLPARGDHEKAAGHRAVALHNSTDFECVCFRENASFAGISEHGQHNYE